MIKSRGNNSVETRVLSGASSVHPPSTVLPRPEQRCFPAMAYLLSSSAPRRLLLLQRSFGGGGWLAADVVAGTGSDGRSDGRLNRRPQKRRQRLRAKSSFGWAAFIVVAVTSVARLTSAKAPPPAGLGHQGQFNSKNHPSGVLLGIRH